MIEQRTITTGPGLTFDVLTAGPPDAPLVLLLHGFAESFHTWRSQVAALAAALGTAAALMVSAARDPRTGITDNA